MNIVNILKRIGNFLLFALSVIFFMKILPLMLTPFAVPYYGWKNRSKPHALWAKTCSYFSRFTFKYA